MIDGPTPPLRSSAKARYDDAALILMEGTEAKAVALLVVGGNYGNGFVIKQDSADPKMTAAIVAALRIAADDLEKRGPG